MQSVNLANIDVQEVSNCAEDQNRETTSDSEWVRNFLLNFDETAPCTLPIRTVIYLPATFRTYISRQNDLYPVSTEAVSDEDEAPPDLIADSDDDGSDSSLSCNSTIASMMSFHESDHIGSDDDEDDIANL